MKREEILKWAMAEARSIIGLINEAPYHSTHEHTAIIAAAIVEILEADRAEREAASLIRSQAAKIEALKATLLRCRTVLGNMALENEGAIFNRWPINHEPLRNDARQLLPVIDDAIRSLAHD